MRKILFILFVVLFPNILHSEEMGEVDDITYTFYDDGTASVGRYLFVFGGYNCVPKDREGKIVIPARVKYNNKSYRVTAVEMAGFADCSKLTSIELPASVKDLSFRTFENCTSLEKVIINGNIERIGSDCFKNCSKLKTITLPNSVKTIVGGAFQNCSALENIVLPEEVNSIGLRAFSGCVNLKSIIMLDKVMSIEKYAFQNCKSLITITIPQSVSSIGDYVFSGCTNLEEINIPTKITRTSVSMFEGCTNLRTIIPHEGLAEIGDSSFKGCTSLNSIDFLYGINKIGSNAFEGCIGLSELILPKSVVEVGTKAFANCLNLSSIKICNGALKLEQDAFEGCSDIHLILEPGIVGIGDSSGGISLGDVLSSQIVSLTISQSVMVINEKFHNSALSLVVVNWRNPNDVQISDNSFNNIPDGSELIVPIGTKELYKQHRIWGRFSKISEKGVIVFGDTKTNLNSKVSVPILLHNDAQISGIQFKLTLPVGVSVLTHDNNYDFSLTERTTGMTFMCNKDPDEVNSYLFIGYSMDGACIEGSDGAIMNVKINIDSETPFGKNDVKMEEVYLTTSTFETIKPNGEISELIIQDIKLGDVNNDGSITAKDASLVLQLVAKKVTPETEGVTYGAADVNDDGQVTAKDASMILQYVAKKITW